MSTLKNRLKELDSLLINGNVIAAERGFSEILEKHPKHESARLGLILSAVKSQNISKVEKLATELLADKPNNIDARYCLAIALIETGNFLRAKEELAYLRSRKVQNYEITYHYGAVCYELQEYDEAEKALSKVIAITPNHIDALVYLANICLFRGNLKASRLWCNKAFEVNSSRPQLISILVHDLKAFDIVSLKNIDTALAERVWSEKDKAALLFARSEVLHHQRDYSAAAENLQEANDIINATYNKDISDFERFVSTNEIVFTPDWLQKHKLKKIENISYTPVFIVGAPRSGTSLIQQILSSNPKVYGAGECTFIYDAVRTLAEEKGHKKDLSKYLPNMSTSDVEFVRSHYIQQTSKMANGYDYIVDKMPGNVNFLAIIAAAFPEAKIIFTKRDAIACCFSIYQQFFQRYFPYAYNQKKIAQWFLLIKKMSVHWQSILPRSTFIECDYDMLVQNPEKFMKQLVDFCGLEWSSDYLLFHEQQGIINTASAAQVRQSLYSNANEKWKAYAPYLKEMQETLDAYKLV